MEASTELSLTNDVQVVAPSQVHLEETSRIGTHIMVFRAWIPRDHWHAYQIAAVDSQIIVLGGFQSPDIASIAEALAFVRGNKTNLRELAEKLSVLADNSGGVRYLFPDTGASTLRSVWRNVRPAQWPNDTTFDLGGGVRRVRLTLLSQETRSYTQHWIPTVYAFTFASNGRLQAWSRRSGPAIGMAEIGEAAM